MKINWKILGVWAGVTAYCAAFWIGLGAAVIHLWNEPIRQLFR